MKQLLQPFCLHREISAGFSVKSRFSIRLNSLQSANVWADLERKTSLLLL